MPPAAVMMLREQGELSTLRRVKRSRQCEDKRFFTRDLLN